MPDQLVGDEARDADRDERRDHEHDPAEAAEDDLEREDDRGELGEERRRDAGRDAGHDERLDERRRPAQTGRDGRGEVAADHRRRRVGAERHPEPDARRRAADRDRRVVAVQPAFVLDDAIDDVRQGAQRLRPHEPDDQRDDDARGGDERDQRPGTERRERVADPVEDDAMDEPERLVEQPDADRGRDTQQTAAPPGRGRSYGRCVDGSRVRLVGHRHGRSCFAGHRSVPAVVLGQPLAGLDPVGQAVLGRRQRARVVRRVDARRVVGEVEVEDVGAVLLGLDVEVAAGAVGLVAARRVEERARTANCQWPPSMT